MAERDDNGWWGWLQTAKDKVVSQSNEVLDFVKKDINEFTKVVTDEASSALSSTATVLKDKLKLDEDDSTANQVKKSMSGFLNHVSEVFTPPPDDEDQEAIVIRNQQPVILNRLQAAIYAISQDPATFLTDPEGQEKQYDEWLETFDLKSRNNELSDLMVDNQALRDNYTTLVPSQISHMEFWHRYFYKVQVLEEAEEKRRKLKQRAEETNVDNVAEMVWDEDEEFGGSTDIPEHVQTQLLEEYERECEEQNNNPSKTTKNKENENDTNGIDNDKNTLLNNKDCNERLSSRESPLSSDSNEDEWEKVDADETEITSEETKEQIQSNKNTNKNSSKPKGEDWENWE